MKQMLSVSRMALAGALAVSLAPCALAAEKVGVNAAIRNKVEMKTDTDAAMRPAVVREPVHLGDAIASGPQSSLQMLLLDKTVFTIGANARVSIDRFVYDPDRGTTDIAASVAKGAFRFMSGRLTGYAGRSAIRTPVATIGVRGTIVAGAVGQDALDILAGQPGIPAFTGDPSNAVFVLLDGPGRHGQGFDKPGAIDVNGDGRTSVPIEHAGQGMLFLPGLPPIGPFDISDEAYGKLLALLNGPPESGNAGDNGSAAIDSGDILNAADFDGHDLTTPNNVDLPMDNPEGDKVITGPGGPKP